MQRYKGGFATNCTDGFKGRHILSTSAVSCGMVIMVVSKEWDMMYKDAVVAYFKAIFQHLL
jgi:hypothetical protein